MVRSCQDRHEKQSNPQVNPNPASHAPCVSEAPRHWHAACCLTPERASRRRMRVATARRRSLTRCQRDRANAPEGEGPSVRLTTTRLLFSHWDRLRGERAAPTRADIDPAHLRGYLADVFMLDAHPWQEGRIRLAGTRICALFGHELKGQRLPDLWLERERSEVPRRVGAVTGGMHGLVASLTGETAEGRELDAELLLLPVRPNAGVQCGAIGSFAAMSLPPWFGFDSKVTVTTKTI